MATAPAIADRTSGFSWPCAASANFGKPTARPLSSRVWSHAGLARSIGMGIIILQNALSTSFAARLYTIAKEVYTAGKRGW
jgi:hypothetical protein